HMSDPPELHLGLILPNFGDNLTPERLVSAARAAEDAGFDSGWVTDHVMVPAAIKDVYGTILDVMVSLGFLAATTARLKLGVSALIVPQRNPLVVLKQLTTLDFLSKGRVLTAVAAGWLEGEFRTLNASFQERGKIMDAWLELAVESFDQMPGPVRHDGHLSVEDAWLAPGLVARPEIWAAGVSNATLKRATLTGVWHPVALRVDDLREMAASFRDRRPDGRVVLRIDVDFAEEPQADASDARGRPALAGPPETLAEGLGAYIEAGCDGFVVNLGHDRDGLEERVARFGEEVVASLS
ncbi:MAG: LLM class flavin-dependent oxidoreductase, partial [Actinomycetota bacterium]